MLASLGVYEDHIRTGFFKAGIHTGFSLSLGLLTAGLSKCSSGSLSTLSIFSSAVLITYTGYPALIAGLQKAATVYQICIESREYQAFLAASDEFNRAIFPDPFNDTEEHVEEPIRRPHSPRAYGSCAPAA